MQPRRNPTAAPTAAMTSVRATSIRSSIGPGADGTSRKAMATITAYKSAPAIAPAMERTFFTFKGASAWRWQRRMPLRVAMRRARTSRRGPTLAGSDTLRKVHRVIKDVKHLADKKPGEMGRAAGLPANLAWSRCAEVSLAAAPATSDWPYVSLPAYSSGVFGSSRRESSRRSAPPISRLSSVSSLPESGSMIRIAYRTLLSGTICMIV